MNFFKLTENKTTVRGELYAALITFLAMIYIVPTNAFILAADGATGMPVPGVMVATTIVTIVGCLLCAFISNTPIAMSTGMGLNVFFAYGICVAQKVPFETALGAVFISGLIFLVLSFTNFRLFIIKSIPEDFRRAIGAGVGAFIAFLGLNQAHIVQGDPITLVKIGDFSDPTVLFSLGTLAMILCFWAWNLRAGFILAVAIASVFSWATGIGGGKIPESIIAMPDFSAETGLLAILGKMDVASAASLAILPAIMTLLVTHLFDSIGTTTGAGMRGGIFTNHPREDGSMGDDGDKKLARTLIADAVSTCAGAAMGTSTVTAFVESSAGVEVGGRTGLTNVFIAALFAVCLFILPIFQAVPAAAIYPILIMVGVMMFTQVANIDFSDPANSVSTFFVVAMMPFTYSITTGIAFGFISYVMVRLLRREFSKLSPGIYLIAFICVAVFLLQFAKFN